MASHIKSFFRFLPPFLSGTVLLYGIGSLGDMTFYRKEEKGYLTVAFRFRSPMVETCSEISPEEQRKTPIHMQQKKICIRSFTPYTLTIFLNNNVLYQSDIFPKGVHKDRPLSFYHRIPLPPKNYSVKILLSPREGKGETLQWEGNISLLPRTVHLFTIEEDRSWIYKHP